MQLQRGWATGLLIVGLSSLSFKADIRFFIDQADFLFPFFFFPIIFYYYFFVSLICLATIMYNYNNMS